MTLKERKNSNAGMTLLEVIVAVSIFSIAAIVLLQSFVMSGRINKKSNIYLEATTVAQNLMEEVKANDMAKISRAFNYPKYKFSFMNSMDNVNVREVLPSSTSGNAYSSVRLYKKETDNGLSDEELASAVTASVISKDGGITYDFNPRKKGTYASEYYFEATNIKSSENSKEEFDALITFDGSKTSGYKKERFTDKDQKNDIAIPNIETFSTKTDALISIDKDYWKSNFESYVSNVYPDEPEDKIKEIVEREYPNANRTYTVTLDEESGGIINVKFKDCFECYGYGPYDVETSVLRTDELKNICIFYYPNYNSIKNKILDNIVFDNNSKNESDSVSVNLYVVKQKDKNIDSNRVSALEKTYKMSLNIIEKNKYENWSTNPSLYPGITKLRTNIDYTILKQILLKYTGDNIQKHDKLNDAAQKLVKINSLDAKEVKDRIYTTKVEIYKSGAANRGFPSDELIVSLDGSKEE